MGAALKFKQTNVARQQGEQARLKVVEGPDYGAIYVITAQAASVGRGEENDIVVSDLKASRLHAQLSMSGGNWSVKDLGSANGIRCNGQPVKQSALKPGDTVSLGETTLEFITSEAGTMFLVAPPKAAAEVRAEHAAFASQINKVRTLFPGAEPGAGPAAGSLLDRLKQNPRVAIILAVLGAVALIPGGDKKAPATKKPAKETAQVRDLASYLETDQPKGGAADLFYRTGFREYRERNYLRARRNFETALSIAPGHVLAERYLANCNKEIEEEIKFHLDTGKKDSESGKLKSAKGHFEAVMRLLYQDKSNASYVEASDQLEKLRLREKGEGKT